MTNITKEQTEKMFNLCSQLMNNYLKIGNWGAKQNDDWDKDLNFIWTCDDYNALNNYIVTKNIPRGYIEKKWFSYIVAKCDEFLFYSKPGIIPNPNSRDQEWDIEIVNKNNLRFDIKSTKPYTDMYGELSYQDKIIEHINNSEVLARRYYLSQSDGVRECYQNRLFIVHCPLTEDTGEKHLKTRFQTKNYIFNEYIKHIMNENTIPIILQPFPVTTNKGIKKIISDVVVDIIFIIELEDGRIGYQFASNPIKETIKIEKREK